MILLVASNKDIASLNIKEHVLNHYPFEKTSENFQETSVYETDIKGKKVQFVTLKEESVYAQNLTSFFNDLELIVFISRHSSESGKPTLSVHTSGNLGEAKLGGVPRKVSFSPANAMRSTLRVMARLKEQVKLDYEVTYEGTHHGPSLDVPTMFAELGSSPKQWNDLKAAEVVAHAAIEAISEFRNYHATVVLGMGGTHYNAKFTRIALEEEVAFGHMIPKYAVSGISMAILKQCVERTLERVDHAVLDWKGIKGEDKRALVNMLTEIDLPFEKV